MIALFEFDGVLKHFVPLPLLSNSIYTLQHRLVGMCSVQYQRKNLHVPDPNLSGHDAYAADAVSTSHAVCAVDLGASHHSSNLQEQLTSDASYFASSSDFVALDPFSSASALAPLCNDRSKLFVPFPLLGNAVTDTLTSVQATQSPSVPCGVRSLKVSALEITPESNSYDVSNCAKNQTAIDVSNPVPTPACAGVVPQEPPVIFSAPLVPKQSRVCNIPCRATTRAFLMLY